ncbi:MAG: PHP domain-containing protein, partial [Candidatus Limnocylindrales bacterium]
MTSPSLPPDDHVHSQFSWDAVGRASMDAACARAVELGLPSVAFTEHLDLTPWFVPPESRHMFPREGADYIDSSSTFHAPAIDFEAYFEAIDRCRTAYPSLRILTGLEIGEPHWFPAEVAELAGSGRFERVLGSLHSARVEGRPRAIDEWFHTDALEGASEAQAVRDYLAEATAMIEADDHFEVFAHIDYLVRQIHATGRDHDPLAFEAEYRETLGVLARSGRALEINTRLPLDGRVVRLWHEVGGPAVSFGSDAHTEARLGYGFEQARAMAEAVG